MQSSSIIRDLYIKPPLKISVPKGTLLKIFKLPYGICEAGRQWTLTLEKCLTKTAGLKRAFGANKLYRLRRKDNNITLIIVKPTDILLLDGDFKSIERLADLIFNTIRNQ